MNEDVKVKFIDALLSGEYTQGKGKLRLFNNTVCANGILCELAIKDGLVGIHRGTSGCGYHMTSPLADGRIVKSYGNNFPPNIVFDWAGISYDYSRTLAGLNDDGASFEQIAEWVKNGTNGL